MKNNLSLPLFVSVLVAFASCHKDSFVQETKTNTSVKIVFNHRVGNQPLLTNGTTYINDQGENYTVNNFKYYISNFSFTKTDGTVYSLPKSIDSDFGYFLVNHNNPVSKSITLPQIPVGDYVSMSFNIGTDEQRDTVGAQTGALAVDSAMFWGWNFGYIYMKLEGTTNVGGISGGLTYHIGGSINPNCIRRATVPFNADILQVRNLTTPELELIVDINEILKLPNSLSFVDFSVVMSGKDMTTIADNYTDMFSLDHIHN